METQRDNNFTDKQLKGITILIKASAKSYPFIKGWKFIDKYEKYNAHLYIILIIDAEILSEEVGLDIKPYYTEKLEKGERIEFDAIFLFFEWGDYGTKEWEEMAKKSYNFGSKIKESITNSYSYLPEDMKIYYSGDTSFGGHKYPVSLIVDGYITAE